MLYDNRCIGSIALGDPLLYQRVELFVRLLIAVQNQQQCLIFKRIHHTKIAVTVTCNQNRGFSAVPRSNQRPYRLSLSSSPRLWNGIIPLIGKKPVSIP